MTHRHASDEPLLTTPETRPFWQELVHAFLYPLTLRGLIVIAGTTGLMVLLTHPEGIVGAVARFPRFAFTGFVLCIFLTYCFLEVIQTSAGGTRWFPKLIFSEFDWIETLLYGIEGVLVSYLPDIVYLLILAATQGGFNLAIFETLRALGCLYLPMALLSLAIWRDMAAVSPHIVLPLMRKIPGAVVLSAVILWAANSLHLYTMRASFAHGGTDVVLYGYAAAAYLYFVAARVIGIAHWVYRQEIGWFR